MFNAELFAGYPRCLGIMFANDSSVFTGSTLIEYTKYPESDSYFCLLDLPAVSIHTGSEHSLPVRCCRY